eukprot:scaffold34688_cov234-Amphora_coffeaeformis.AAC.5
MYGCLVGSSSISFRFVAAAGLLSRRRLVRDDERVLGEKGTSVAEDVSVADLPARRTSESTKIVVVR